MWKRLADSFKDYPSRAMVAQKLLEYGVCVKGGVAYCGNVEIGDTAIARATGTDRRTVRATLDKIERDRGLKMTFENLMPTCSLKTVASAMKWGVIEILPEDVRRPGILCEVTKIISEAHISIRQTIADDPDLVREPKAVVVTESPIPPELLPRIKAIRGIKGVVIY
jgi:predicted regulator of amino acid metabolism with ACT domain